MKSKKQQQIEATERRKKAGPRSTHLFWNGPKPGSDAAYEVKPPKIVRKSRSYRPKQGEMNVRQATKKEMEEWSK